MSEGNILFIILHYTDNVVYTCLEEIMYLAPYITLTRLYGCIYMSGGNTLLITLNYTDKGVHTCQKVMLYLSLYTTLTMLYIHAWRK